MTQQTVRKVAAALIRVELLYVVTVEEFGVVLLVKPFEGLLEQTANLLKS